LQVLLDRQDSGQPLTAQEREEAEGLVDLAEFLTLLRLRVERMPHERHLSEAPERCSFATNSFTLAAGKVYTGRRAVYAHRARCVFLPSMP
jgi:hypothetical protein